MRQVTHALLTRPPLSHKTIIPEGNQVECFVRLACVKHAASVHPEPGSNSHVKVCHSWRFRFVPNLLFKGSNLSIGRSSVLSNCLNILIWIFQGFSLFSYQCSFVSPYLTATWLSYQILSCLSTTFLNLFSPLCSLVRRRTFDILLYLSFFVNNFFTFVCRKAFSSLSELLQYIKLILKCQAFLTSLKFNLIGNLQLNAFPNQLRYNIMLLQQSQPKIHTIYKVVKFTSDSVNCMNCITF